MRSMNMKKRRKNLDIVAGCFGNIMSEIFAFRKDEWEEDLRRMGFFLGKYIYLMDAYEDMEKDEKTETSIPSFPCAARAVLMIRFIRF